MPDRRQLEGELRGLQLSVTTADRQVSAALTLNIEDELHHHSLDAELGRQLTLEFSGAVSCVNCGRLSKRSFGSGYCYPCFRKLARCDLCMVSPDRCHHHLGTCREPQWGDEFCMQPHLVYLANTSGLKVGLTREGREQGRWMDQGAVQAMPVLSALTRRDAGLAEVAIAGTMSDKTAWQKLVAGDASPVNLLEARNELKQSGIDLPQGVSWLEASDVVEFRYPIRDYPTNIKQLRAGNDVAVTGTLLGIKGQYLLMSNGVFNVRRFSGFHVCVSFEDAQQTNPGTDQLDLF